MTCEFIAPAKSIVLLNTVSPVNPSNGLLKVGILDPSLPKSFSIEYVANLGLFMVSFCIPICSQSICSLDDFDATTKM